MRRNRIDSIDLLRGIVIVLMGLDHVRDFFGPSAVKPEDLEQASAALFLTRWITHFCAPVFLFLAGLGAALYQARGRGRAETARFLVSRGLFLVVLELTVVNTSWLSYWSGYVFVQVIWVIGWSMVVLAGLLYLPRIAILLFSLLTIFGHNLLDGFSPELFGSPDPVWAVLHGYRWIPISENGFGLMVIYSLVPWVGVMSLGYLFGPLYETSGEVRRRRLRSWGFLLIFLFVLLRVVNLYGEPSAWAVNERGLLFTALELLNTTKYPASLAFVLMTLGPALLLLPALEGRTSFLARRLVTFGRVPLFFYLLHLPFIHLCAMVYSKARYGMIDPQGGWIGWYLRGPQAAPPGYEQSLWLVWGVWILVTVTLYFPCRRYAELKKASAHPLLSYL